jgi:TonB-dependent SusC/RagA subfamily outer membrane receptor
MTFSSLRATFRVCALIGLAAGCASTNTGREGPRGPEGRDAERDAGDPIAKRLQAQEPGILVTRTPDGGIAVQIRGPATFYGSSQPLYVIDDVPVEAGPGGVLAGLNPHDIESIKVLKNPEDIGIYGVRGANGVIVIRMRTPGVPMGLKGPKP